LFVTQRSWTPSFSSPQAPLGIDHLGGDDRASFPYWAGLDDTEILACMQGDSRAARIHVLSQIAVRKYGHLRRAVDLSLAALALLALAAAGTAL
jgi:hypothetical protein